MKLKRKGLSDLPGGAAVRTECFPCRGRGFASWLGDLLQQPFLSVGKTVPNLSLSLKLVELSYLKS